MKIVSSDGKYLARSRRSRHRYLSARSKKRRSRTVMILAFMVVLNLVSVAYIANYISDSKKSQQTFSDLANQIHSYSSSGTPSQSTQNGVSGGSTGTDSDSSSGSSVRNILPQFQELYARNKDFYGWVQIPGTTIDYPVMYTPSAPQKYLHSDFDGAYSAHGTPFLDASCNENTCNQLIYAHRMRDKTMFYPLSYYAKETYWIEHPTIVYSTLYESAEYEIFSAFYDKVYYKTDTVFKFYQFIDADSEEEFDYGVSQLLSKSLYDTGITPTYGDQLITLVTCSYHETDGRFVVVARKKT